MVDSLEDKRKADFFAYFKAQKIETGIEEIENMLTSSFMNVENVLRNSGFDLDTNDFLDHPITSSRRTEARNNMIRQYNMQNPGSVLPTSREQTEEALSFAYGQLGEEFDFSDPSNLQLIQKFGANIAHSTYHSVVHHPWMFFGIVAASIIAGPVAAGAFGLGAGAIALMESFVGQLVKEGVIVAAIESGTVRDKNQLNRLLEKQPTSQIDAFGENFLGGVVGSLALKSVFKGVTKTLSLGKKGVVGAVKSGQYRKARGELMNKISEVLSDASAEVRADIFELIKQHNPSGIQTLGDKLLGNEQIKTLCKGVVEKNQGMVEKVLNEIGPDFVTTNPDPFKITVATEENFLNQYTSDTLAASERLDLVPPDFKIENIKQPNDKLNGTRSRLIDELGGIRGESPAELFNNAARIARDSFRKRRTRSSVDSRIRGKSNEAVILQRLSTASYQTVQLFPDIMKVPIRDRQKIIHSLFLEGDVQKNFADAVVNGFSAKEITNMSSDLQKSAIAFNKSNNLLRTFDTALKPALATDSVRSGFFGGNSIPINTINGLNALLETIDSNFKLSSDRFTAQVATSFKKGNNTNYFSANKLDPAKIFDAVTKSVEGTTTEDVVAKIWKNQIKEWQDKVISLGMDITAGKGHYPNKWDPQKVFVVSKDFFVNRMRSFIDEEAVKDLAAKRNRPIRDMDQFLGNMYESIRADQSARTSENVFGDLVSTGDRILVLKDGASWLEAHELFGKHTSPLEIMSDTINTYRKVSLFAELGIGTVEEATEFNKSIFNAIKKIAANKEGATSKKEAGIIKQMNVAERQFEQILHDLVSEHSGGISSIPYVGPVLKLARKTMISTSALTALFVDYVGSMPLLKSAIGIRNAPMRAAITSLKSLGDTELRQVLGMSLHIRDTILKKIETSKATGAFGTLLGLPEFGASIASDINTARSIAVFGITLEQNSGKTFAKLRPELRNFLSKNAITATEWEIYRKLPAYEMAHGAKAKFANNIANKKATTDNIIRKFAVAERAASLLGAPNNTFFGKVNRLRPGLTRISAIKAFVYDPFANITQSIFLTQWNQIMEIYHTKGADAASLLMVQLLYSGYLTYYSKALLRGAEPQLDSPDTLIQAALYGGISGSAGDAILESIQGFNNSALGPLDLLAPVYNAIKNKEKKGMYSHLRNAALALNPYKNVFLTGQVLQRFTLDKVFMLIDPEGYDLYNQRIYDRLESGKIKPWAARVLAPQQKPLSDPEPLDEEEEGGYNPGFIKPTFRP